MYSTSQINVLINIYNVNSKCYVLLAVSLLDPTWRMSLSFLIILMVMMKLGFTVNGFLLLPEPVAGPNLA